MAKKKNSEPKIIKPDDVNPHYKWDRPIGAPGHTQVDFEERVNFRRLHDYRLARTRAALANSGLGALLSFDQHNIRYTTSIAAPACWVCAARPAPTSRCSATRQRRSSPSSMRRAWAACRWAWTWS